MDHHKKKGRVFQKKNLKKILKVIFFTCGNPLFYAREGAPSRAANGDAPPPINQGYNHKVDKVQDESIFLKVIGSSDTVKVHPLKSSANVLVKS